MVLRLVAALRFTATKAKLRLSHDPDEPSFVASSLLPASFFVSTFIVTDEAAHVCEASRTTFVLE